MEIILKSAIAEISPESFAHPGLRLCRFVFCDDQPNENKMGIEYQDFAEIKSSAIGTPIKMKFFGNSAGGHFGSIPIGYINNIFEKDLEDGVHQLIAEATLFADEYPDEVEYLTTSFAEGKAPGISWELKYENHVLKDGISWLKGLITRAATFVRNPAYGNRTAILALASNKEIDEEQMMEQLSEIISDSPKITEQGGNNRMDEKIKELQDQIDTLTTALSEKDTKLTELSTQLESLTTAVSSKDEEIATYRRKELVAERTAALVEAGIALPTEAEKLAAKQAFYASLTEEGFAEYKSDLTEAIAAASKKVVVKSEALASVRNQERLPRFDVSADAEDKVELSELRGKFKTISRVSANSQSE